MLDERNYIVLKELEFFDEHDPTPAAGGWNILSIERIIPQPFPKTNIIQNVSDNMYNMYTQENSRAPSSFSIVVFLR